MIHLDAIKKAVISTAKANSAECAILFGSYARDTATDRSDVDVIFIEETDLPFLERLSRYLDPLIDKLHTSIEVLVYTPREFEDMKDKPFIRQALKEGLVLYESGKDETRSGKVASAG